MRDATDVTAGEFRDIAANLAPEHDRRLMGGVVTCFPADGAQDPFSVVSEDFDVEIDWRILA